MMNNKIPPSIKLKRYLFLLKLHFQNHLLI